MAMTITEKILAYNSGLEEVKPGDLVSPEVSVFLTHDVLGPDVADIFNRDFKEEFGKVWNNKRIVVTPDHFIPCCDVNVANRMVRLRKFVKEQNIVNFYPEGIHGVCHEMLAQEGFDLPGYVIVGTDSHTDTGGAHGLFSTGIGTTAGACVAASGVYPLLEVPESMKLTYDNKLPEGSYSKDLILKTLGEIGAKGALKKAMEFEGKAIEYLSLDQRRTICNMAVEGSAINGIIAPDEKVEYYVANAPKHKGLPKPKYFKSDKDANYSKILEFDAGQIEPQVSVNYLPADAVPVTKVEGQKVDQAFIGSCTNGKWEDMETAADYLEGRKVSKGTRLIIIPATQKIWYRALEEGLLDTFYKAGASVSTPTCGPCLGGHMGVLGKGERCISSSNRNFRGRMGDSESFVYLASPATVAVSAVEGKIADPRRYL
ncbi:MAG: 3-isopropylmalate dehydratase large subunit [Candidatus Aenigmatarchaeota archaeon]